MSMMKKAIERKSKKDRPCVLTRAGIRYIKFKNMSPITLHRSQKLATVSKP